MNKLKNIIIRKCKKYIDERGEIYISEINKILKMKIERIFIVYGKKNKIRGKHAHKFCNQVIFLINGKIQIIISDGSKKKIFNLSNIGEYGGQEVPHLHFHLFGGEKIGKMVE